MDAAVWARLFNPPPGKGDDAGMSRTSLSSPGPIRSWPGSAPAHRRLVILAAVASLVASLLAVTAPAQARTADTGTPAVTSLRTTASAVATAVVPAHLGISLRKRAQGFVEPIWVGTAPDASGRMFVAERRGTIRVFSRGQVQRGLYLDIRRYVNSKGGEQGLLGVAFHPQFGRVPIIWVTYTRGDGALVLARVRATTAAASSISWRSLRTVLVVPHPGAGNHNGGEIGFNVDGLLYLGTGDGGGGGDPWANAQNAKSLLGKMLRLNVTTSCGTRRYCIPATNPYARSTTYRREIYHVGLRNPWRWSFDSVTHAQWIGDVGQNKWEEVDRANYGARAINFGWSCREGRHFYNTARCRTGARYASPVFERCHPDTVVGCTELAGAEALIGGYVYRGRGYPVAYGTYVAGDFVTGNVVAFRSGAVSRIGSARGLTAFGAGPGQELWAVTYAGALYGVGFYAR